MGSNPTRSAISVATFGLFDGEEISVKRGRWRQVGRWGWTLLGIMGSYFGAVSLLFILHSHQRGLSQRSDQWLLVEPPTPPQRLLVVAPHPDDETLGCGGLIYEAQRRRVPVYLVFLTNGDGYPAAATLLARRKPNEADYIRLGQLRQAESRRAAHQLGVPDDHLFFLGYPDQGLWALWQFYPDSRQLFRSKYTRQVWSPYPHPFRSRAIYCGQMLIQDLLRLFRQCQPTDVYVTHPLDDHPDHFAASVLVMEAFLRAQKEGSLGHQARLHYYLVHRGDWPLPQGYHPQATLLPPAELSTAGERWYRLELSEEAQEAKEKALASYESQCALMGRFLRSFLRRNEVYATASIPTARLPHTEIRIDARTEDWKELPTVHCNPGDDDPLRHLQAGADILRLHAARTGNELVCLLEMRGKIMPQTQARFYLCAITRGGILITQEWSWQAGGRTRLKGFESISRGRWLEVQIPLPMPQWERLFLMVETSRMGMRVDRTGYILLQ